MQNSGKPEFCWHPSKESASFKAMDCRVKPGNDADGQLAKSKESIAALLAASALTGAEPIEALLLLVAQRSVELLERGLDGLHRAQHRIEPLLHRLQAADGRERRGGGAIRVQQIDRLGRGVLQLLERAALRSIGLHGAFDPLQRQARDTRCALAADLRQAALSLLLVRIVGAERVEACLLLV